MSIFPIGRRKRVQRELTAGLSSVGWQFATKPKALRDLLIKASLAIGSEAALLMFATIVLDATNSEPSEECAEATVLRQLEERARFFGW